jgi:hypothetical protein
MTFERDEVALRRMMPSRVVVVRTPWCSIGNAHGVGVFRLGRAPSLKMTGVLDLSSLGALRVTFIKRTFVTIGARTRSFAGQAGVVPTGLGFSTGLPGTAVPGFPMPPLRGWGGDLCYAPWVFPWLRKSRTEEMVRGDPVDGSGLGTVVRFFASSE